jgi:hypothetical protein
MGSKFSEANVHEHMYAKGLEILLADADAKCPDDAPAPKLVVPLGNDELPMTDVEEIDFQFWRLLRERTIQKLKRLHGKLKYGNFIGSKIKLPIDTTQPMELDLLGEYEDGLLSSN